MRDACPRLRFGRGVLKNAMAFIDSQDGETNVALELLLKMKDDGDLEYLQYRIDAEAGGVLSFLAFSFRGAANIARRCRDIATWDATHHVTRFNYNLHTVAVVSSERTTTSVLTALTLGEDGPAMSRVLACFCQYTGLPLPKVMVTDGDLAMAVAIAAAPDPVRHLRCFFI